jgi:hypothetical protein
MEAIFDTVHKLLICWSGAVLTMGFMFTYVFNQIRKEN